MKRGRIPGVNIAPNTASGGHRRGETGLFASGGRDLRHCAQYAAAGFRTDGAATPAPANPARGFKSRMIFFTVVEDENTLSVSFRGPRRADARPSPAGDRAGDMACNNRTGR